MKLGVLLFILFYANFGYSQDNYQKSDLSIEINYSLNYNYRTLSYEPSSQGLVDAREKYENILYGYYCGITLKYLVKGHIKLDFGIQYALEGSQYVDAPIAADSGFKPGLVTSKYKYSYIVAPIRINYPIISKSIRLNGILGFSPKYLIDNRSVNHIMYTDGQTDKTVGKNILFYPNKVNVNVLLGFGTYFTLNKKLQLNIEPIFRYALRPLTKSQTKQYNYSFGLHIGIEFNLL